MPETYGTITKVPLAVRSSMRDRVGHSAHGDRCDRATREVEDAGNATHQVYSERLRAITVMPAS